MTPEAFDQKVWEDYAGAQGDHPTKGTAWAAGYNAALSATKAPAMWDFIESLLDADLLPEESREEAKALIGRGA